MAVGIGNDIVIGRHMGVRLTGGGAGFTGAYDAIPSITAAYGMRRLRSAYTGNILRLRRASDNAESDFGYDSNGDLDAAAIATWLTATTGYVTTWYDQSGNEYNATQTTAAAQPLYVASGQNGKPVARFDGTDDGLTASVTVDTVWSVMAAGIANGTGGGGYGRMWSARNDTHLVIPRALVNQRQYLNGTTALTLSGAVSTAALFAITNNTVWLNNGSDGTITTDTLDSGDLWLGNNYALTRGLNGDYFEFVAASATWSAGDRAAAFSAANAYWSVYA